MNYIRNLIGCLNPLPGARSIWRNRELLRQLVRRNLEMRFKGSLLGFLWFFIQPLLMLAVYTFVFSVVFQARWGTDAGTTRGSFAVIMFAGVLLFTVFSESLNLSSLLIVSNPNYVKKVVFPLELLPLAQVLTSFLQGTAWLCLLFLGAFLICGVCSWTMLLTVPVLLPFFFYTLGLSYLTASVGVYLRDTPQVLGVILQILFFATPIFYPVSAVPEELRFLLELNPMTDMIEQLRAVVLFSRLPDAGFLMIPLPVSLVVFLLGFAWFNKTKKGFADVL